jgi:hypothetical protein
MSAPGRWKDENSGASPELREVLQHAHTFGPDAAQVAALTSAVLAKLPSALPASAAGDAASGAVTGKLAAGSALGSTMGKLLMLALACALSAVAALTLYPAKAPVERSDVPAASAPPSTDPVAPKSEALAPAAAPSVTMESPQPARAAKRVVRERARTAAAAPTAKQGPADELALLNAARTARRSDPQAALAFLHQHERDFRESTFREEREALLIELLMRVDPAQARTRLAAFDQRYPHSAYRKGLSSLRPGAN